MSDATLVPMEPERKNPSIRLRVGAEVLMALVYKSRDNSIEEGYVLVETGCDFVTWHIYRWLIGPQASDVFEAESGHYFHYDANSVEQAINARRLAEKDFQKRVTL